MGGMGMGGSMPNYNPAMANSMNPGMNNMMGSMNPGMGNMMGSMNPGMNYMASNSNSMMGGAPVGPTSTGMSNGAAPPAAVNNESEMLSQLMGEINRLKSELGEQ